MKISQEWLGMYLLASKHITNFRTLDWDVVTSVHWLDPNLGYFVMYYVQDIKKNLKNRSKKKETWNVFLAIKTISTKTWCLNTLIRLPFTLFSVIQHDIFTSIKCIDLKIIEILWLDGNLMANTSNQTSV